MLYKFKDQSVSTISLYQHILGNNNNNKNVQNFQSCSGHKKYYMYEKCFIRGYKNSEN